VVEGPRFLSHLAQFKGIFPSLSMKFSPWAWSTKVSEYFLVALRHVIEQTSFVSALSKAIRRKGQESTRIKGKCGNGVITVTAE
jgi:hypothetical protein